jgi:hypothetical protein
LERVNGYEIGSGVWASVCPQTGGAATANNKITAAKDLNVLIRISFASNHH